MDKIVFADKTEFEIKEGASLNSIVFRVDNFAALQVIADAITKKGNLDEVNFKINDDVTGVYTNMRYDGPLFTSVDVVDRKVEAKLSIREKSETEVRLDKLEENDKIQDEAILDVANLLGGE